MTDLVHRWVAGDPEAGEALYLGYFNRVRDFIASRGAKDAEAEEVAQAIRAAYNGEVHLDPAVSRLLAQRLRARKDAEPVEPLTAREKEVLTQLAKGASNKEIAYELGITERTARTHVSNILGKLGLASRTQAALYAVEHKLVQG